MFMLLRSSLELYLFPLHYIALCLLESCSDVEEQCLTCFVSVPSFGGSSIIKNE
jgi:hypothetical protein